MLNLDENLDISIPYDPDYACLIADGLAELAIDEMQAWARTLAGRFPGDPAEILAIGPLGGRYIVPEEDGLAVYDEEDDPADPRPTLTIPRGLPPEVARLLVKTWDRGFDRGWTNGREGVVREMARHVGGAS